MKKTAIMLTLALSAFRLSSYSQSVVYGTDEKDYATIRRDMPSAKVQEISSDINLVPDMIRYKLSGIGDNWFATANVGASSFIGSPKGCSDLFGRTKPMFMFSIGKWHSPFFGTRLVYQGFKLVDGHIHDTGYGSFHGDLMWNISSYFHRSYFQHGAKWNVSPYIGAGVLRNNDLKQNAFAVSYGINVSYTVSDHVAVIGEIGGTTTKQDWDGIGKKNHVGDNIFQASLGLSVNIGKKGWQPKNTTKAVADYYPVEDDSYVKYPRNDYSGLNSLRRRLGNGEGSGSVPFNTPILFFFKINSTKFVDANQMNNIREIAAAVNEYDLKLKIVGAADSHTGTPAFNRRLSIRRCKYIAKLLIKAGVSKSRMRGTSLGGVNMYSPYPANRHTCVIVYKDTEPKY